MKLLKKAENQQAFLKAGIFGFAGSGKTYTAGLIAVGLAKLQKDKVKPVGFIDTETGSDFLIRKFEKEKVELTVAKTRAFSDLNQIIKEAENECSVLVIDSISHIWRDLMESYAKKMNRKRLTFRDWAVLKREWGYFTDLYINSKVHIIMCGRAGFEYEYFKNDDGKMELTKTGTKMKVESEMGFEPSLLLEMERVKEEDEKTWTHKCYVLKDRTTLIHGKTLSNPCFKDFMPVIKFLNIGGEHVGVDTTRSSENMFDDNGNSDGAMYYKRRDIALEEIENELTLKWPGHSADNKKAKIEIIRTVFDTTSWEKIKIMKTEQVELGLDKIREIINQPEVTDEMQSK